MSGKSNKKYFSSVFLQLTTQWITLQGPWWPLPQYLLWCLMAALVSWLVLTCQVGEVFFFIFDVIVWMYSKPLKPKLFFSSSRGPEKSQLFHPSRHHHCCHLHIHHLQPPQSAGGLLLWSVSNTLTCRRNIRKNYDQGCKIYNRDEPVLNWCRPDWRNGQHPHLIVQ